MYIKSILVGFRLLSPCTVDGQQTMPSKVPATTHVLQRTKYGGFMVGNSLKASAAARQCADLR
jgi:hypothetical protein